MQKMMEIILYLSQEIECEIYSSEVMKKICNKARNLRQENSAPNPDVLIHVSSAGKYRFSYLRPEIPAYSVPQCRWVTEFIFPTFHRIPMTLWTRSLMLLERRRRS
jgi:hypothetical protein